MDKKKNIAQIKHLRNNYKRFHIDFRITTFEKFQELCVKKNTTPTTEIKKFVEEYIEENSSL